MKKLALLLAVPLAGCISFGGKAPESLLTLTPQQAPAVGQPQRSNLAQTVTVAVPSSPQVLSTTRIPVNSGGTAIAYVKDAQWVERPSQLFARLVSDTVSARTGRLVLSTRQSLLDPGAHLTGDLRMFGVDADTNEVVVAFEGSLIRGPETVIEKQLFEARVPVTAIEPVPVAAALNQAANQVAAQVADWIGG